MIFIVCQRVILIYFSAKTEMVARLRGHDRFFVMYRDILGKYTIIQVIHLRTAMLAVGLPDKLEEHLSQLVKQTHRSKNYYVKQAIQDFLDEQEDHLMALSPAWKKEFKANT